MRFLFLNQAFHPDVVATAQYLTPLAVRLAERGHQVTVVTGRRAYDRPEQLFPARETWRGIEIHRVGATAFGKGAKWRRAADFAGFLMACGIRLASLPKQDVVVALTSPPLISCLGALFARLRGGRFCYWVMDLNPDAALAAGWLRAGSLGAWTLERLSRFSLRRAARVIALDSFMRDRITGKGVPPETVEVIPPWMQDSWVRFDAVGRDRFRRAHGLEDKFVVMHSGNHSPCHSLDTVLGAARKLTGRCDIAFCFVGGGSEFARVQEFAAAHRLANIKCLPYQSREELAGSLSAADLHVVVMGEPFVGLVHPCKVYNILAVGAPFVYIGPRPSHVTSILDRLPDPHHCLSVRHGEVDAVAEHIERLRLQRPRLPAGTTQLLRAFGEEALLGRLVTVLESMGAQSAAVCSSGRSDPCKLDAKPG